ncbi:MAG TPA: hypothetical protein VFG95_08145 [Nitrospiria bacterium]|nr:hypothetical protein [Nitrospiria bacterium]
MSSNAAPRTFAYEEAIQILPKIQRITQKAISRVRVLAAKIFAIKGDEGLMKTYEREQAKVVNDWVLTVEHLGCEIKVLWAGRLRQRRRVFWLAVS